MTFHVPEKFRLRDSRFPSSGNNGAFIVALKRGQTVRVIATDEFGWEHVSVSRADRCPTWDEMCQVKSMFWDADDCVMQLHPPEGEYVNNHPYCLHLWRPAGIHIPVPPAIMVGIKGLGEGDIRRMLGRAR